MHPAVYGQLLRLPVACGQGELCLGTWSPFTSSSWPLRSLLFLCSRELDAGWCLMHLVKGQRNAFARDVGTCGLLTQASSVHFCWLVTFFFTYMTVAVTEQWRQAWCNEQKTSEADEKKRGSGKNSARMSWLTYYPFSLHTHTNTCAHIQTHVHARTQSASCKQ